MENVQPTAIKSRKRKAENQDNGNERLSKRLSLLNLEHNGEKLYVPVESPTSSPKSKSKSKSKPKAQVQDDDTMHLDNTAHKVYIYDLDAELSDSESSDDGRLIFLPDIQKHLLETRIPTSVLANHNVELAGNNQLVLYNIPSSLTIPEEHDSVRKAIIEARARARANQDQKRGSDQGTGSMTATTTGSSSRGWYNGMANGTAANGTIPLEDMEVEASQPLMNGNIEDDPDAMDIG